MNYFLLMAVDPNGQSNWKCVSNKSDFIIHFLVMFHEYSNLLWSFFRVRPARKERCYLFAVIDLGRSLYLGHNKQRLLVKL